MTIAVDDLYEGIALDTVQRGVAFSAESAAGAFQRKRPEAWENRGVLVEVN